MLLLIFSAEAMADSATNGGTSARTYKEKGEIKCEVSQDFDEESHFKEVFEQYLAKRKECGESVEGMTLEKFSATLRKNRDQILAKHDARGVRFTVYEKAGKASLKASPIKK